MILPNKVSLPVLLGALALSFFSGQGLRRAMGGATDDRSTLVPEQHSAPSKDKTNTSASQRQLTLEPPREMSEILDLWKSRKRLVAATAYYRWLESIDAEGIRKQMQEWIENGSDDIDESMTTALVYRWAELDPAALKEQFGDESIATRAILIAKLTADPQATLKDCPPEHREFALKFVGARHPSFDLEWAQQQGLPFDWFLQTWLHRGITAREVLETANLSDLEPSAITSIFRAEAARLGGDQVSHFAALLSLLTDPAQLQAARVGIRNQILGNGNPFHALRLIHELELSGLDSAARVPLHRFYQSALSDYPGEAARWISSLPSEERKKAIKHIYSASLSGSTNTRGFLSLMLAVPRDELKNFGYLSLYLRREVDQNPRHTLEWMEDVIKMGHFSTKDPKTDRQIVLQEGQSLGLRLARIDVDDALAQARAVTDETLRDSVLGGIVSHLASFDPERAQELLSELSGGIRIARANELMRNELVDLPLERIVERLEGTEDPTLKSAVAHHLVLDPNFPSEDRAALADRYLDDYPQIMTNARLLISRWARTEPQAAADWTMKHQDHDRFVDVVRELVDSWARVDISGAASWVIELEPGPARDRGVEIVTRESLHRDPRSSLEWASVIANPEARMRHLRQAVIEIDTQAVEADDAHRAINALSVSTEERAQLLQHLKAGS